MGNTTSSATGFAYAMGLALLWAVLVWVCDRTGFWLVPLLLTLAAFWPGQEYVEEQWGLTGLFLALLLWRETRRDGAGSARLRRGG